MTPSFETQAKLWGSHTVDRAGICCRSDPKQQPSFAPPDQLGNSASPSLTLTLTLFWYSVDMIAALSKKWRYNPIGPLNRSSKPGTRGAIC